MKLRQIVLVYCLLATVFSSNNAFAFNNCQSKYDSDKRSLPQFRGKCNICHLNENGTGPQNKFGKAFAAAGFKITDEIVTQFPDLFQKPKDNSTSSSSSSGDITSKPDIKRIKPNKVKANVQTMISVIGKNFADGTKAFIDNTEVTTSFKSSVLLIIDFILNTVGNHELKLQNPDGQESNTVKLKAK